ncbi:MAG TPA: lysophospholipid acyltransferase family protein [Microthrixaceae bacterium]|nr:lysophospholipid acyltransferase family protein [Microthrixaceae bacterium]
MTQTDLRSRVMNLLQRRVGDELEGEVFQRDPTFIREHLPTIGRAIGRYFAPEVRGVDRLPSDAPFLLVSNHSGGWLMPDAWALWNELLTRFGADREFYGLMLDFAFVVPVFGDSLRRFGAIPASMANAERALASGAGVMVFPGGAWEVYRPWTERNRIDFHGHQGFVRLALSHGVPVFPVVSHGSHHSLIVISRGDRIGHLLGIDRLRVNAFPFAVGFPFGVTSAFMPNVPIPAKIIVEVLEPISWSEYSPGDADDPDVVRRCYEQVTGGMQAALDRLAREMPRPLRSRLLTAVGR